MACVNIEKEWEEILKPKVLSHRRVPVSLVAEILGCSVDKVNEMLRCGHYSFGVARKGEINYSYDIYPLRFIAWYEGKMQ